MPTMDCRVLVALVVFLLASTTPAQRGDHSGEQQPDPPARWRIPDAPVLTPDEAQRAFVVAEGFRVELVAAEPLVVDPVSLAFDPDGRIWVAEMRSFMPNVDGTDEEQAIGTIAVLEDTDDDGRMDRRFEFADGLVLPRAVAWHGRGALFIEPPYLRWFIDDDGDMEWDRDAIVSYGFGGLRNVEHAANGLLFGIDNWLYLCNHAGRFRQDGKAWTQEPTGGGGQWGITQDDWGRLYYNTNSDQLRGDVIPTASSVRNPNLGTAHGINLRVVGDQTVWPARMNPGVNRGYQKGTLRDDGRLRRFTAACGPVIYRGDAYPKEFSGNAFVAEPAGNLVKRNILEDDPSRGIVRGRPAYTDREFLASTDERFRPVNLFTGPDGCLYVVDMYRGIIQHRLFVTSYLRRQILSRGLERPVGLGRIWRIVPPGWTKRPRPGLSKATNQELVEALSHGNGWWRDMAQRLLIQRPDAATVVPALVRLARNGKAPPVARIHAQWTLEGLGALDEETVLLALRDPEPKIQVHGLRLAETLMPVEGAGTLRETLLAMEPSSLEVRRQHLLTLGSLKGNDVEDAIERRLRADASTRFERDAALTGLYGLELPFLERLLDSPHWVESRRGRPALLEVLAACVTREGQPDRVRRLLALAATSPVPWQRQALLDGVGGTRPPSAQGIPRPLRLDGAPVGFAAVLRNAAPDDPLRRVASFTTWPGHPSWERLRLRPLAPKEKALYDQGGRFYGLVCAGCHQADGRGLPGLAPTLAESDWVSRPPDQLVRILHAGLTGPIDVRGERHDLEMPGLASLTDDQIASILTYVRRSFGNEADPVTPSFVTETRNPVRDRETPFTAEELESSSPASDGAGGR